VVLQKMFRSCCRPNGKNKATTV